VWTRSGRSLIEGLTKIIRASLPEGVKAVIRPLRQLIPVLCRPKRLLAAAFPGEDPQSVLMACNIFWKFGYAGALWHEWRT
jgi:hypothetical protein